MTRYAGNAAALRALVRDQEVHRDVYVSEEVFQLEMAHMFPNSWVYVGHDSQVPNAGDYFGTTIGTQPVLLVRHTDGKVHVLHNRCPAQGHAHHFRDLRQHRKVLPLPLPCLELQDRRLAARNSPEEGIRKHRLRAEPCRARNGAGAPCQKLSRLRVRQDQ